MFIVQLINCKPGSNLNSRLLHIFGCVGGKVYPWPQLQLEVGAKSGSVFWRGHGNYDTKVTMLIRGGKRM
jgi:hypothetical protein